MVLHSEADGFVDTESYLLLFHVLLVLGNVAHGPKDATANVLVRRTEGKNTAYMPVLTRNEAKHQGLTR